MPRRVGKLAAHALHNDRAGTEHNHRRQLVVSIALPVSDVPRDVAKLLKDALPSLRAARTPHQAALQPPQPLPVSVRVLALRDTLFNGDSIERHGDTLPLSAHHRHGCGGGDGFHGTALEHAGEHPAVAGIPPHAAGQQTARRAALGPDRPAGRFPPRHRIQPNLGEPNPVSVEPDPGVAQVDARRAALRLEPREPLARAGLPVPVAECRVHIRRGLIDRSRREVIPVRSPCSTSPARTSGKRHSSGDGPSSSIPVAKPPATRSTARATPPGREQESAPGPGSRTRGIASRHSVRRWPLLASWTRTGLGCPLRGEARRSAGRPDARSMNRESHSSRRPESTQRP